MEVANESEVSVAPVIRGISRTNIFISNLLISLYFTGPAIARAVFPIILLLETKVVFA